MPLPIGILASALSPDLRDAARIARTSGFTGVQLDSVTPSLDVTTLSQTGRRELRHVLSSNDLQLIGLRADTGLKGFGPGADIDRILFRAEKILDAAKGLGAPLVCIDAGPLPEPERVSAPPPRINPQDVGLIIIPTSPPPAPQGGRPVPGPDPATIAHVDNALSAMGALSDRIGVIIAFRSDLSSFAALNRALSTAHCPTFGIDFDPVAALGDEWPLDEIFSRLGPFVRHVRARDAIAGQGHRTKPAPIGAGSTGWPELLSLLDQTSYNGWLTIDPMELSDRLSAAHTALTHLKRPV